MNDVRRLTSAGLGLTAMAAATSGTLLAAARSPFAQTADATLALPPPQTHGGMPLMQALAERRSARRFAARALAPPLLANLLWAGFGVNRPASGGRTAPSAHDQQEIDVYLLRPDGSWRYRATPPHRLERIGARDLRDGADSQGLARAAPLTLLYVVDERRMTTRDDEATRRFYAAADAGVIAQNVYLFCAGEGLATVVFISIDRERLARALGLAAAQRILLAQAVGHPADPS